MATATLLTGPTTDTGNTPNSTGSFAPSTDDLLVVVVTKEASALSSPIVSADCTSSVAPTAFTLVRTQGFGTSAHQLAIFVANGLTTNTTSRTVTLASGADAGGGTIMAVYGIAGMSRVWSDAVRQSGGETDQASGEVPSVDFGTGVALTGNAIVGAVGAVDNTPALTAPASFTEDGDTGYTTGATQGLEIVHRNSGHTSQTVAWQTATIGGSYATVIVELDTSVPTTPADLPLQPSAAVATTALALTAATQLPLAASAATSTTALALNAPTELPLQPSAAVSTASLVVTADEPTPADLPLQPSVAVSTTSLGLGTLPYLALSSSDAASTTSLALNAPTLLSLAPSAATSTATLDLTAPEVGGGDVSAGLRMLMGLG